MKLGKFCFGISKWVWTEQMIRGFIVSANQQKPLVFPLSLSVCLCLKHSIPIQTYLRVLIPTTGPEAGLVSETKERNITIYVSFMCRWRTYSDGAALG